MRKADTEFAARREGYSRRLQLTMRVWVGASARRIRPRCYGYRGMIAAADLWGENSAWFWAFVQLIVVAGSLAFIYVQILQQAASGVVAVLQNLNERWTSTNMLHARRRASSSWLGGDTTFDGVDVLRVRNTRQRFRVGRPGNPHLRVPGPMSGSRAAPSDSTACRSPYRVQ